MTLRSDRQSRTRGDDDAVFDDAAIAPGKVPTTLRAARRSAPQIVFRLESPEVARELGGALRDGAMDAIDRAASSAGAALPSPLRARFEDALGADLGDVRVHTGAESVAAARAVGARAYAYGQDIHFGAGQYDPSSASGQYLIAHEVAHTVQQRGATPTRQDRLEVSSPGDASEVEADAFASSFLAGASSPVTPVRAGSIARAVISRVGDDFDPNGRHKVAQDSSDPDQQPGGSPWDPDLQVASPNPSTVMLNATTSVAGVVTNAAAAPAGTTMGWAFSYMGGPGLAPEPRPPQGPTGSPSVKVISLEQMQPAPTAAVLYQIPGKDETSKDAPTSSPFTVVEPVATFTLEHINGPRDSTIEGTDTIPRSDECLVLGDTVKLHAKIDGVNNPSEVASPSLVGGGATDFVAPVWEGNTLTYTFVLQQPANSADHQAMSATMKIDLPAGGTPRSLEHEFLYRIVVSKQRFLNLCTQATTKITEAGHNFSSYLSSATLAYANAYNAHKAAIGAIGEAAAAADAFTIGLIEAAVVGATTAFGGALLEAACEAGPVIEGVKEMATFGAEAAKGGEGGSFAALPGTDPLAMQAQVSARVEAELAAVTRIVVAWEQAANSNDPSFQMDFDPFAVTMQSLVLKDGTNVSGPVAFDAGSATRAFQQGFFCAWVDAHAADSFMATSQNSWYYAQQKLVAYGVGIGVADAAQRIDKAVDDGVAENNRRAIASGHPF